MPTQSHLAPLRRSVASSPRASWAIAAATMLTLLLFAAAATIASQSSNSKQVSAEQSARTESVAVSIEDRIAAYNEVLFGVRGAFGVDDELTRRLYHELLTELAVDERQPGVQVIGAAHLVDADDHEAYEAEVNRLATEAGLDYPVFEIYPEPSDGPVLPIDFIEPQVGNERAFGLDFMSEANRRTAAERARDTGLPSATGPITLVQETETQRAFLVMLPIYDAADVSTLDERRDAFVGVTYAAFRMGDLMNGVLGADGPDHVAVFDVESGEVLYDDAGDFTDGSALGRESLAAACPPLCGLPELDDDRVMELDVAGRTWRIYVDGGESVLSSIERSFPAVTLLGGILVTGLVVALAMSMRTARRRALDLATEMTDELEALTESADEAIVSIDDDGTIVAWNQSAERIFGADADTMIGRPASDLAPAGRAGDELARIFSSVHDSDAHGAVSTLATGRRSDGTEFPVEVSLSQWSARGRRFLTGFMRDVTDRVTAERQLVETGNLLRGVLDAATGIAIIGMDVDGTISVFNTGAELMLGYRADELIGTATPEVFHDSHEVVSRAAELGIEPGFEVFVNVARTDQVETRRWTYVCADGRRVPVELTVTPRYDGEGALTGFIGVAIDVTERLAALATQQALLDHEREMVAKLTELDRVKNDFVSTISHELRTPLTSILGYAELLADDGAEEMATRHLDMVDIVTRNAQRLLLLVEDLLMLSRIESGELHMEREPCDLARICEAVESSITPLAENRDIRVRYDVPEGSIVLGDPLRLERVMLNLLSNAIKFSFSGQVVDVRVAAVGDDVEIRVIDRGIGIAADELEHLFDRFFRSRTAERHAIQGTGLGLTIVSDIVQRHHGRVDVESVEGSGTTMIVLLPAHRAADKPNAALPLEV